MHDVKGAGHRVGLLVDLYLGLRWPQATSRNQYSQYAIGKYMKVTCSKASISSAGRYRNITMTTPSPGRLLVRLCFLRKVLTSS